MTGATPAAALHPAGLLPEDYLLSIDESHQTIPQIWAMYNGDLQRKRTLVEHGFRLPSALDNRPLRFEEFLQRVGQVIFVSATPDRSNGRRASRLWSKSSARRGCSTLK